MTDVNAGRFPRTATYHPDWLIASVSGGANPLYLAEWVAEDLDLKPGMRVLDLGCGRAASSIFLHREWGVQVWATDLWINADENLQRIRGAGIADGVFPIHADARALPFAADFFDVILALDSFVYYGTDDLYLEYLVRFVKPGGVLAMAGAGLTQEITGAVPDHLHAWWEPSLWCLHSAAWWRRHWERTGLVDVVAADTMADGWQVWHQWQCLVSPDNHQEIDALSADQGRYLGYTRMIGTRRAGVHIADPITTLPTNYTPTPLLRAH